ncbi:MAG: YceI family protein [Solirubrobacteraceae bacterium]
MSITPGTHALGPDSGTLRVKTKRGGVAAKAGHDLTIEVTSWDATLDVGEDPGQSRITLTADARSLRVREGTGGIQALGEDDKDGIRQTIEEEVLRHPVIEFRSHAVEANGDGDRLHVHGELDLAGRASPITFELMIGEDGHLLGSATVKQTAWGIKPYSALFGTLKVADEVEVTIDATLPGS